MYCYQCGTQIADESKFCSGCGRPLTTGPEPRPVRQPSMATHVNILAWLFIGSGIVYAMIGFALVLAPAIIRNLPVQPELPFDMLHFISSIAGLFGFLIILVAAGTTAAGVGLLQFQTWGRTLALVMSAVNLIKLPFGTALGIYGFWVLLSERGREYYENQSSSLERGANA